MAEITQSDIKNIGFQDDVDSFPHRTNYANLKNRHNQLNTTVNKLSTAASGAEITASRPNHEALIDRLDSIRLGQVNYLKTVGVVAERGTPDLNVFVSALQASVGGVDVRKGFGSWARTGTTITMTEENHGRSNSNIIKTEVSSAIGPLPLQEYPITNVTTNTFDITGVDTGDASGTAEFATLLGPVVAPSANPRLDYLVANSDNSLSILTGSEGVDPIFPAIATTQLRVGCLVMKTGTTSLNDDVEIFTLEEGDADMADHYIGTTKTINQGRIDVNNLIIDATVTFDASSTSGFDSILKQYFIFNCAGNIIISALGSIVVASTTLVVSSIVNGNNAPLPASINPGGAKVTDGLGTDARFSYAGGVGGTASRSHATGSGGGGGGAPSIIGDGGSGGDGIVLGAPAGGNIATSLDSNAPLLFLRCQNFNILGLLDMSGADGVAGSGAVAGADSAGGGGSGGNGGGLIILIAIKDVTVASGANILAEGGDGGDGEDSTVGTVNNAGGGGGGGGGGGFLLIRSLTLTNSGTISAAVGGGGAAGAASGGSGTNTPGNAGDPGTGGVSDQALYDDVATDINHNRFPINIFDVGK